MKRKKIGILGGTFNPVHNAHIQIAKLAKEDQNLDEVWFIPTFVTTDKLEIEFIKPEHRLKMLKLAIKQVGEPYMHINEIEISKHVVSYTYVTIQELATEYPDIDFFFILGDDRFNGFDTWQNPDIITDLLRLIVVHREGNVNQELVKKYNPILLKNETIDISSSKIRHGYLEKLPSSVLEYISNNFLYLYTFLHTEHFESNHKRFNHGLSTGNMARKLAELWAPDLVEKAYYAGLMHDFCKYWDQAYMRAKIKDAFSFEELHPNLLHQYMVSIWFKETYKLKDEDIINAVKFHTSGRPFMSTLEKIVYIADKVEIGRDYPEASMLRELAISNGIDKSFAVIYITTYEFILKDKKEPDESSKHTYEFYLREYNEKWAKEL